MASDARRNIVIVGGGVIGCTTAYYLTRHPTFDPALHTVTLIEATRIAGGASGKAGGLLALWAYPSSIVPLSYRLHAELAAEHDGATRWGYRTLSCGSLSLKGRQLPPSGDLASAETWSKLPKQDEAAAAQLKAADVPEDLDWFREDAVLNYSALGDPSNTAQVQPYLFTNAMAELAQDKGAKIVYGSVTAIDHVGNKTRGLTYEEKGTRKIHTIPATDVIVAAGPWTKRVLADAPIAHTRAHSVTIKADVSPYAVFSEIQLPASFGSGGRLHSRLVTPEMYARPNGEIYACGEGDHDVPLPSNTDLVQVDNDRCQDIIDYCASVSDEMAHGEVLVRQACYLPNVVGASAPIIGQTDVRGLFIAAGHTVWGIQNSAATGKVMSELVFDGRATSANIATMNPKLYM